MGLIYTAYDGDLSPYSQSFRAFVQQKGQISVNPTICLNYYLSTIARNNSKRAGMLDCLALKLLCDEMWIFVKELSDLANLPEGVLLELLSFKNKCEKIQVFLLDDILKFLQKISSDCDGRAYTVADILKINNPTKIAECTAFYEDHQESLPKTVCIDMDEVHVKYADWIKLYAFSQNLVPILLEDINPVQYQRMIGNSEQQDEDLKRMINRNEFRWFIVEEKEALHADVYTFVTLEECRVPKYVNKEWAITTGERVQAVKDEA